MLIIIATCSLHHAACQHVQATSFTAKETEHSPQLRITDRSNSWHLHLPGAIQPARQIPGVTGVQSSYMAPKWLAAVVLLLGIPAVFASAGATVSVGARVRLQGMVVEKSGTYNGREGVVDQADPFVPGRWMVQLRTSTGLRDGPQVTFDKRNLHVISAPPWPKGAQAQFVEMLPTPLGAARDAIMLREAHLPTGEADDLEMFLKVTRGWRKVRGALSISLGSARPYMYGYYDAESQGEPNEMATAAFAAIKFPKGGIIRGSVIIMRPRQPLSANLQQCEKTYDSPLEMAPIPLLGFEEVRDMALFFARGGGVAATVAAALESDTQAAHTHAADEQSSVGSTYSDHISPHQLWYGREWYDRFEEEHTASYFSEHPAPSYTSQIPAEVVSLKGGEQDYEQAYLILCILVLIMIILLSCFTRVWQVSWKELQNLFAPVTATASAVDHPRQPMQQGEPPGIHQA